MHPPKSRLVLDSDTISFALRGQLGITEKIKRAAAEPNELYLCPVVYYEVGATVVTYNTRHFARLRVPIEDWVGDGI